MVVHPADFVPLTEKERRRAVQALAALFQDLALVSAGSDSRQGLDLAPEWRSHPTDVESTAPGGHTEGDR